MAEGITNKLINFSYHMRARQIFPRETRFRDRSLRGKDRIKARKAANKEQVNEQ